MIATYRETVTLTLNRFQDQGLVELGRRSVRVLDSSASRPWPRPDQEAPAR